jgi:hypothetical protein
VLFSPFKLFDERDAGGNVAEELSDDDLAFDPDEEAAEEKEIEKIKQQIKVIEDMSQ